MEGDRWELREELRAGKNFGTPPFDDLFVLGMDRDDTDLWMRGHLATRDGRKGSSPVGNGFFLTNTDVLRRVYGNGLLSIEAGSLLDVGKMAAPMAGLSSGEWLVDTGVEARLTVPHTSVVLSWGARSAVGDECVLGDSCAGKWFALAFDFGPAEGAGEVLEVGWLVAFEVDTEDVEAGLDILVRKLAHVVAGQAAENAALAGVDSEVGRGDLARGPGFDLDEAEGVALRTRRPGDEVQIAGGAGGMPGAGDDDIAAAHEPEEGGALAFEAGAEVLGALGTVALGGVLDGVDRRLHETVSQAEKH